MESAIEQLRPHIRHWAARFERAGARGIVDAEDLERAAELAAWRLRARWDPTRSSWKTFAGSRVVWAMKDELRLVDWLPRLARQRASAAGQAVPEISSLDVDGRPDLVDRRSPAPVDDAAGRDLWAYVHGVLGRHLAGILEAYFREGKTLKEIGFSLGKSESRVCQQFNGALIKLRRRAGHGFGEEG